MERMNQELEQYLQFFVNHKQKDWPEWSVTAEFAVNNKTHSVTKVSPYIANYSRESRMEVNIKKKGQSRKDNRVCWKDEESIEESWGSINKVMLNIKDLVFKK